MLLRLVRVRRLSLPEQQIGLGDDADDLLVLVDHGQPADAVIAQQPGQEAELALEYAKAKITGEGVDKIEKSVVIPNVAMTKDNLGETEKYMYAE